MKIGLLLFLALVALLVWFSLHSDPLLIKLEQGKLRLYTKKCAQEWPVRLLAKESDMVDALQIERDLVELPNGQKIYVEIDDLPPRYDFDRDYRLIVEKIFGQKFKEIFAKDGVVIYRSDFDVALFYKTSHDLVLLYPLDSNLARVIIECAKGHKVSLPKEYEQPPLKKSRWRVEFFILDGFVNKDI